MRLSICGYPERFWMATFVKMILSVHTYDVSLAIDQVLLIDFGRKNTAASSVNGCNRITGKAPVLCFQRAHPKALMYSGAPIQNNDGGSTTRYTILLFWEKCRA